MRHFACAGLALLLTAGAASGQEKTAPPPPNTKIEGMPAIPQSVLDGVARYGQYRSARLIAWSPTKRQMIVTTSFSASPVIPQIHLVDGPGRDRRQLTWYGAPGVPTGVNASFDPADGNTFIFPYDPGGTELRSIYRYDLASGEIALVTESKMRYVPTWSKQGKWLAYDSLERNGKDRDLYVIQPADPKTRRRLADFTGAFSPHDWSPDGTALLANEVVGNAETYLWRVDVKTGEKKAITPRDGEKAAFYNPRFSSDGRKVYAISNRAGDDWRVWRCDVANCVWTAVTPDGAAVTSPNAEGSGFAISPDGTLIAVTVDHGGVYNELQLIDLTTLKPRNLPAIPQGTVSQLRWRPGSRELGFTLASVKSPGDAYSIDTSLGTLTRWTFSEATFNAELLPPPEPVQWKSFDGLTISGFLYKPGPKFTGPRPVMVSIHGGPDGSDGPRWQGRSNYLLNELGVAILVPNVRGSTGSGKKFMSLDDGRLRGDSIKDIGALLDWIPSRPDLDKSRVVLVGISSGGWLALQAGAEYNDRIRGVIEGAGMTNLVTFLEKTREGARDNRRQEYGDERDPQMREFLLSLSPVNNAAKLTKPTFVIHPGKDDRVPVSQAQELVKALRTNNPNVWYLEFSEANHDNLNNVAGDYLVTTWAMFIKAFVLN
jgi:dipeptidyl aminopeptidase/acylaminoacyl peptidase